MLAALQQRCLHLETELQWQQPLSQPPDGYPNDVEKPMRRSALWQNSYCRVLPALYAKNRLIVFEASRWLAKTITRF